jgi:hypothetical protein
MYGKQSLQKTIAERSAIVKSQEQQMQQLKVEQQLNYR